MNMTLINQSASKFYDMYENDKLEDLSFWQEYEAHMSRPVDETENLLKLTTPLKGEPR